MEATVARVKYVHIAPRKLRLVADLVRGKKVAEARSILHFNTREGAVAIGKALASAVANAESRALETRERINTDDMVVSLVRVDGGPTVYRYRSAARGRGMSIRKRCSHIELFIAEKGKKK